MRMTRKEMNIAIFEGTAEGILWQPRLETWISHHMEREKLPARFRGMNNLEIYDALGCSIRYLASACESSDWIDKPPSFFVSKTIKQPSPVFVSLYVIKSTKT